VIDRFSSFFPGKSESDVNSVLEYLASNAHHLSDRLAIAKPVLLLHSTRG
jgi:hypothetical protein